MSGCVHVWEDAGYRLAYVPGGRRYLVACAACGLEADREAVMDDLSDEQIAQIDRAQDRALISLIAAGP